MNNDKFEFTAEEREECLAILEKLKTTIGDSLKSDDEEKIREHIQKGIDNHQIQRDVFNLNPVLHALQTAEIAVDEIGLKRDGVLAILLYQSVVNN